jgi:hypothetical protein
MVILLKDIHLNKGATINKGHQCNHHQCISSRLREEEEAVFLKAAWLLSAAAVYWMTAAVTQQSSSIN